MHTCTGQGRACLLHRGPIKLTAALRSPYGSGPQPLHITDNITWCFPFISHIQHKPSSLVYRVMLQIKHVYFTSPSSWRKHTRIISSSHSPPIFIFMYVQAFIFSYAQTAFVVGVINHSCWPVFAAIAHGVCENGYRSRPRRLQVCDSAENTDRIARKWMRVAVLQDESMGVTL